MRQFLYANLTLSAFLISFGYVSPSLAQNYTWAKAIGNVGHDAGRALAIDASGNVYSIGYFQGTVDFDPGVGTASLTSAGGNDIFISKLDALGNFVWAKRMGGASNDGGYRIVVDASGNVYSIGYFQGTADFDPGAGTTILTSAGGNDIFISKLDASGNYVWAKSMGGAATNDYGNSVAVDASGNVYSTGYFEGTADFDPGAGTANLISAGGYDIFISKLDASGNNVWAKSISGAFYEYGYGIAIDDSSNVYTTGNFQGTADFDPGAGTANLTSAGGWEIFISKLDAWGNYVWAKRMGEASDDYGTGIAVDDSDNVYTTGMFGGIVDFDPNVGTANLTSAGGQDIFISKLDALGNYVWAKNIGGTGNDNGGAVAVDASGAVYATGFFEGIVDFDPGAGTTNLTSAGVKDIFISKLDASGNYVWAKGMGGVGHDYGLGIAVHASGNVFTVGSFNGTVDFDPGVGTANLTSAGDYDIFISKLSLSALSYETSYNTEGTLIVFPNPSNDIFTITGIENIEVEEITILNSIGQKGSLHVDKNGQLDLSNYPAGVYYLQVCSTGHAAILVKE